MYMLCSHNFNPSAGDRVSFACLARLANAAAGRSCAALGTHGRTCWPLWIDAQPNKLRLRGMHSPAGNQQQLLTYGMEAIPRLFQEKYNTRLAAYILYELLGYSQRRIQEGGSSPPKAPNYT